MEGTYAPVTIKKDAGTVTYTSPDAGGVNHTYFRMKENTRLDVGARTINFRLVEMDKTAVIESSSGGSIACSSQYDNKSVSGTLRGNLSIRVNTSVNSDRTFSISGDNTHTGGFLAPGGNRWNSAGPVYVDSDTGLGTGPVAFVETDTRSAIYLRFRSTSPSIGSLESSYRSEKNRWIHLGRKDAPVNNTELSIGALGTDTVYHDLIADYAEDGATGSVHKVGSGRIVFTAPLTYHGRTTVSDGTLLTVHNEGFSSGTLKYTCVEGSPDITITAGGADALAVGQVVTCDWGFNPKDNLVLAIDGNVATLDHAATGTTTQNKNLAAKTCTATIGNDVLVDGGTFAGSGRVVYDLSAGSRPMVLTSGVLDISGMTLEFTGTPANHSYVVVDYSAGGTFIGADNDATLDTFAAVENIPGEFRWRHFRDSKQVVLYFPPPATLLLIY